MRRGVRLPLEQLQPYLIDPGGTAARPIDFAALFGNDHPVEMEVGFGKGLFLLTASMAHPEINYLGVEIERKYQLFTANRIAKRHLTNVRLACADARTFLPIFISDACLQAIHVYFPDPWWKRRHMKRRLFTPHFVAECARILEPGGVLHIATDVADYFKVMTDLLQHQPGMTLVQVEEKPPGAEPEYLTNFERKFRLQGKSIWRADWRKG